LSEGRGFAAGLPGPRQQFVDALGRMVREPDRHVGQPGLRIDVVELCGLDQRVDGGGAVAARIRATEGPVAAADGDTAQGTFGGIVAEADAAVVEEAGEGVPPDQAVADCLAVVLPGDSRARFSRRKASSSSTSGFTCVWRTARRSAADRPRIVRSTAKISSMRHTASTAIGALSSLAVKTLSTMTPARSTYKRLMRLRYLPWARGQASRDV